MNRYSDPLSDAFEALYQGHDDGTDSGYVATAREDIKFFWNRSPVPRGPRIYDPGIVLIGKGYKLGYQRERTFRYDAENCLVLSLPSAFESEAFASAEEPLLGLFVNVDRLMVLELAEAMGIDQQAPAMHPQPSFEPVPLTGSLKDAAARLASALAFPEEASAIGAGLKQELVYRALKGPGANGLLALLRDNSANSKISKVLNLVHCDYETPFSTEGLAQVAGMSVSSFHRRFRDVTGDSPLQYIKKVRLHRGRVLIEQGQYRPSEVAGQVGYASISQFSREFSRHFDMPPSAALNHARAH